jgi:hypothetical protein
VGIGEVPYVAQNPVSLRWTLYASSSLQTPSAMDAHRTGSVKDVGRCTSFTFTRRSPKEELKTRTSSWFERLLIMTSNNPLMSSQAPELETNHELSTDNSAFSRRPPSRNARCSCFAGAHQPVTVGTPFTRIFGATGVICAKKTRSKMN